MEYSKLLREILSLYGPVYTIQLEEIFLERNLFSETMAGCPWINCHGKFYFTRFVCFVYAWIKFFFFNINLAFSEIDLVPVWKLFYKKLKQPFLANFKFLGYFIFDLVSNILHMGVRSIPGTGEETCFLCLKWSPV